MSKVYFSSVVLALALLSLGLAANVQAEFINGNFEDTTGWGPSAPQVIRPDGTIPTLPLGEIRRPFRLAQAP